MIHLRSYSKRHASNVVKLVIEWLIVLHSHGKSLAMCAATSVMRLMNVHRHVIFTHHKQDYKIKDVDLWLPNKVQVCSLFVLVHHVCYPVLIATWKLGLWSVWSTFVRRG